MALLSVALVLMQALLVSAYFSKDFAAFERVIVSTPPTSPPPPPKSPPLLPRSPSPPPSPPSLPPAPPANKGRCTAGLGVTLYATVEADLYARLNYPTSTKVTMWLLSNIVLSTPLNVSGLWACTSFRSGVLGQVTVLSYGNDTAPAVFVWSTNNIYFFGVGFYIPTTVMSHSCLDTYPRLPQYNGNNVCGALHIWNSYAVEVHAATSNGRVDILGSNRVVIASSVLTAPGNFPQIWVNISLTPKFIRLPGVIRIMACGDPINLVRSGNLIINNDISGAETGVVLRTGSVGTTVRNNYIHNFSWTGIQCGQDVNNVGDCMLNSFSYNKIVQEYGVFPNDDGAGIYFDTHWTNPGNYMACNYILGGAKCLYLDYCSSGVFVDGMICDGVFQGFKLNTGKDNILKSFIFRKTSMLMGGFSCQNADVNNCGQSPGSGWAGKTNLLYATPAWKAIAPTLPALCTETSVNGYSCMAGPNGTVFNANVTYNCSGLPTRNTLELYPIDMAPYPLGRGSVNIGACGDYSSVPLFNSVNVYPVAAASGAFADLANGDFGASSYQSPLYTIQPRFKSCPVRLVGIQLTLAASLAKMQALYGVPTSTSSG